MVVESYTLPFSPDTPPRTPICQDEAAPDSTFLDLDNGFPDTAQHLAIDLSQLGWLGQALMFAVQSNDFAAWRLNGQFRRLVLDFVGAVDDSSTAVFAGIATCRAARHAHGAGGSDKRIGTGRP